MIGRTNAVSGRGGNEWFDFTYTGDFTETYVDGVRTITLTSSGTFSVINGSANASVYMLGAGGGAVSGSSAHSGGGGGYDTFGQMITLGDYEVTVGKGGASYKGNIAANDLVGGDGGSTSAFGNTVTGGTGGSIPSNSPGIGGKPNGGNGLSGSRETLAGGYPNGGSITYSGLSSVTDGGDGKVVITITV